MWLGLEQHMSLETVVPDEASIKSTFHCCGGLLLYWNGDNSRQINTKTSCELCPIHRVDVGNACFCKLRIRWTLTFPCAAIKCSLFSLVLWHCCAYGQISTKTIKSGLEKDPVQAQKTWFCRHKQGWNLSSGVAITNVETLLKHALYYRNVDMVCVTRTNLNVFVVCRNVTYQHVTLATPLSFGWPGPLTRWRSDCNS